MGIAALRTPDDNFTDIPDWPYAPHYVDDLQGYEGLRVHYVDEGPNDAGRTFLCLHGEPSWSYLYRKMIPVFLEIGARVVAPDWLGFGRSDKPTDDAIYTFNWHRNMMMSLIERLDLRNITLVCQDWGGLLGLTIPMEMTDRFERLLVMNTTLAVGKSPGEGFDAWKAFAASQPDMDVGALMQRGTTILSDAEAAAYGAPFPSQDHKAGVRRFPEMVMVAPGMEGIDLSKRAIEFWKADWSGESFMAIGQADPVLGEPQMMELHGIIKNCPPPMLVANGGHFLQEWGEPIARAALQHWGDL